MFVRKLNLKFIALALSVMLVFAGLPLTVFADGEFVSENLLQTKIDMENSSGVLFTHSNLTVAKSTNGGLSANNVVAGLVDGDLENTHDIWALSTSDSRWYGVRYALTDSCFAKEFAMYGDFSNLPCYYDVYVSEDLNTLHHGANLIGSVKCDGTVQKLGVNRYVKYVMVVFNAIDTGDGNARPKEIQLWSGDPETDHISTNLVKSDKLESAKAVLVSGESAADYTQNDAKIQSVISQDSTTAHTDIYSKGGGDTGVQINFNDIYYIGNVLIDAGLFNANGTYNETYTVYASSSPDNLYAKESIVADNVLCKFGRSTVVEVNKYAKYVALVCTAHAGIRIRNICVFDAAADSDVEKPFVTENALRTKLESAQGVNMFISNGNTESSTACFNDAKSAATTDGDTATHNDVSDATQWDPKRYTGIVYTLTESVYAGNATIYSGFDNLPETWMVYASDSLDTLYQSFNKIDEVWCGDASVTVKINKTVKYIAFFCTSASGNIRVKEFELWTADPNTATEEETSLSVLTIGNSFAENASVYATEIAYANGKELTFGYLKSPSCSLQKHLNAALNDIAGFKFQITSPNGSGGVTKLTVKDGVGTTVDAPNAEHGATVKEALLYKNWDVIVFQQESSNARSAETYSYLPDLIEYVKEYCPDARLMFHEVWRWGTWDADQFAAIKSATEAAARANGLEIIPSGLAFEFVREAAGKAEYVNDDDGNYQHANTFGQYVAGVCYVDTLFDIQCDSASFRAHPYINADGNVDMLTDCANKASKYYNSYGDVDFNGTIDATDCVLLRKALLGSVVNNLDLTLADANNDGSLDIRDLIWIKKHLAE